MSLSDPVNERAIAGEFGHPNGAATYAVKLPIFEGPLDLLLHLIRQNEVEITEIPVARVCEQYLEYLELMRDLNLDVAAEYLVMAATLALIKSRMLLPPEGEEEGEEALDPRSELVARLLEYQRYKEVAEALARRRLLGRDVFEVQGAGLESNCEAEREIEAGLFELLDAFREVLRGARDRGEGIHEVEIEIVTVRERMVAVMDLLEGAGSLEFGQLFESSVGGRPSLSMLVATFLAILELARLSALRLYQSASPSGAPEGPIRLRSVSSERSEERSWSERISELM
jgi:segregation and condensation protein A